MKDKEEGVQFLNTIICNSCLEEITKVKVEDNKYNDYIEVIKNIFQEWQLNYWHSLFFSHDSLWIKLGKYTKIKENVKKPY